MLVTGLVITGFFVLIGDLRAAARALSGSTSCAATTVRSARSRPPSGEHLLGTTVGGYDVLSRVIWGAQTAFFVIVVAIMLSIFVGVLLGLVSGYLGGWLDRVLVVVADAVYAFPIAAARDRRRRSSSAGGQSSLGAASSPPRSRSPSSSSRSTSA